MAKVELRNEIMFKAPTRVGLLADVTEALRDAGVNILAIGAYDKGDMGEFLMITSNNKLAYGALEKLGGTGVGGRCRDRMTAIAPAPGNAVAGIRR